MYMHMDSVAVNKNDAVPTNRKVGVSGNSGTSTTGSGYHLHMTVNKNGNTTETLHDQIIDPLFFYPNISFTIN